MSTATIRPVTPQSFSIRTLNNVQWLNDPVTHREIPGSRHNVVPKLYGVHLFADFSDITPDDNVLFMVNAKEPTFLNANPYFVPTLLDNPWMGHPVPAAGVVDSWVWFLTPGTKPIFVRLSGSHGIVFDGPVVNLSVPAG